MIWLLCIWFALSFPLAFFVGAFISNGGEDDGGA